MGLEAVFDNNLDQYAPAGLLSTGLVETMWAEQLQVVPDDASLLGTRGKLSVLLRVDGTYDRRMARSSGTYKVYTNAGEGGSQAVEVHPEAPPRTYNSDYLGEWDDYVHRTLDFTYGRPFDFSVRTELSGQIDGSSWPDWTEMSLNVTPFNFWTVSYDLLGRATSQSRNFSLQILDPASPANGRELVAVPEPSTLAVFALGAAASLTRRRNSGHVGRNQKGS